MKLVKTPHIALSTVADEVEINTDVAELIATMKDIMIANKGCGIAAPQVGVTKRVIILNTERYIGVIINPVLSDEKFIKTSKKEGCLSVSNYLVDMKRYNRVTVTGYNEKWEPINIKLKAFSAFCVQHEVDHLNGITIDQF